MTGLPDLDALEAAAKRASAQDPDAIAWFAFDDLRPLIESLSVTPTADAAFIAACSPDVVTALIQRVRELELRHGAATKAEEDAYSQWLADRDREEPEHG